jgi:GNAT superfamily N-acetyltransferase
VGRAGLLWDLERRGTARWTSSGFRPSGLLGHEVVKVGGIGRVVTKPQFRRRGVASALLARAAEFMTDELCAELALLLCRPQVSLVYAKLGWTRVDGPTSFSQPNGAETFRTTP